MNVCKDGEQEQQMLLPSRKNEKRDSNRSSKQKSSADFTNKNSEQGELLLDDTSGSVNYVKQSQSPAMNYRRVNITPTVNRTNSKT